MAATEGDLLTVALAGSRRALDVGREDLVWGAFLDAMRHLRGELPQPPPYRFVTTGMSAYDRHIADRLAGAGREVVELDGGVDRSPLGKVAQLRLLLDRVDGLAAVWDARVYEPVDILEAAKRTRCPYQVRILPDPNHPEAPGPLGAPPPWRVVSSAAGTPLDSIGRPARARTIGERTGASYNLQLD